jgi:DNA-binding transcriptional LysR family regulator
MNIRKRVAPGISLRHLEAFRAVVLATSITGAASRLRISQPAVSRRIADLERRIGFDLFKRTHRRVCITPEGQTLYREVEKSFIGIEKIALRAIEIRDFRAGYLRIAGPPALSLGVLPPVIRAFRESYPDVLVAVQTESSQRVSELVSTQQCDIGLVAEPFADPGVVVEPCFSFPCVCLLPANHKLARKKVIAPCDLQDEVFISLGISDLRAGIDSVFQANNVRRVLSIETPMSVTAMSLVTQGLGVSIIDPFTASAISSTTIVVKPFLPVVYYEFSVLFPSDQPRSRMTTAFVALLHDYLQRFRATKTQPAIKFIRPPT